MRSDKINDNVDNNTTESINNISSSSSSSSVNNANNRSDNVMGAIINKPSSSQEDVDVAEEESTLSESTSAAPDNNNATEREEEDEAVDKLGNGPMEFEGDDDDNNTEEQTEEPPPEAEDNTNNVEEEEEEEEEEEQAIPVPVGNGPGNMDMVFEGCEDIDSPESLCSQFDCPPSPEPERPEDDEDIRPPGKTITYKEFVRQAFPQDFAERDAEEEEARDGSKNGESGKTSENKLDEEENTGKVTTVTTTTEEKITGDNDDDDDEDEQEDNRMVTEETVTADKDDDEEEEEESKKDDSADADNNIVTPTPTTEKSVDVDDKAAKEVDTVTVTPDVPMETEESEAVDTNASSENCNGPRTPKEKDSEMEAEPTTPTPTGNAGENKDKDKSDAADHVDNAAGDAADDNAMEASSSTLEITDRLDSESSQLPSTSTSTEKDKETDSELGDGIRLNLNLGEDKEQKDDGDGDDDDGDKNKNKSADGANKELSSITASRPTTPCNDDDDDDNDAGRKSDVEAEPSSSGQAGPGKEKEKPSKSTSDTESDGEDADKPQMIFLRDFSEITEQQSESDEEDVTWQSAIPSGIASSYQKTISELQDHSEDSTSSAKTIAVSRLDEIATYDMDLANLRLDCVPEGLHKKKRSIVKLAAFKLNAWLTRRKDRPQNGVVESSPSAQSPITMQTMSQLPISVQPCQRPGQVPVRWQQAVNISSPNNMVTINGRPSMSVMAPNAYNSPQQMMNSNPPPPPPVRVEWPSSVQRMVSRPNAPMHGQQVSFQQVKGNTTPTSFSSSPRLSVTPNNGSMQQQQITQLIFDPATGGVILCPTNQLPPQQQQHQMMQNNRMTVPANVQIQNGQVILNRQGLERNGLEISMLNAASHVQTNHNQRIPPPPPVVVQRTPSPVRQPPPPPVIQQYPRQPMNPRAMRPQHQQQAQRQASPVPGLQPISNTLQGRNMNRNTNVNTNANLAQQPMSRLGDPAALPPRYPSPRVSGIPPVRQITTSKPNTTTSPSPGTVGANVTAGNQKPIPGTVDEGDSDLQNKTFPSLVVHVKTILSVKPDRAGQAKARSDLDSSVKGVLVNTPAQFTEWLMRRGLLRLDHYCDIHSNQTFKLGMYSDVSRQPFSGGYVWTSECCPDRQISVYSGSIFEGSKYPPGTVLKLIYHWACQTPANNVLQWVKITSLYLKNFFTLLRAVCISWLHEMCPPLGGEAKYVEIGVITLGSSAETSKGVKNVNVEILGVFDPVTKIVRMKVINSMQGQLYKDKNKANVNANEQGARAFQILWPLTHWVDKRSILLVDGIIDKALFHELGFKNIQQCSESMKTSATNMNVMNYLRNLVPKMFSSTLSVLSKSIVQQFLDELSWREMYGQTVLQCFENVLDHIGTMTKWDLKSDTLISRLNKVYQNPFIDWSNSKQSRRCPMNTIPLSLRNEPGIRECIRHVMKDDNGMLNMNNNAPSFNNSILKGSNLPPPPPVYNSNTSPATNAKTVSNQVAAQKRKLAENTQSSNLAFYKSHAARHRKDHNLQCYYYGRQSGEEELSAADIIALPPNLKCPLCVRTFSNNSEIIRHLFMHVTSVLSRNESNICSICLKDLPTGVSIVQHVNQVHKMIGYPHNCRICEEKFRSADDLIFHMWDIHVKCEAPYRCTSCHFASSFHYEVVQHYQEKHRNSGSVLCPYCMRIMPAYSLAMLKNIISHLQSHGTRRAKKCPRCVLTFPTENELDYHMMNHMPITLGPNWREYMLVEDEQPVLMGPPPISRTPLQLLPLSQLNASSSIPPPAKKSKSSGTKKKQESKSTLNASFAVPLDTNEKFGGSKYKINIPIVERGKAMCAECQKDVTDPNHFIGRLVCSKCRYITSCQGAMDLHHERSHKPGVSVTKPGLKTKPAAMLKDSLVCKCGFTSVNPYKIARHLIKCEKPTAYPKGKVPLVRDASEDSTPPPPPPVSLPSSSSSSAPPPPAPSSSSSSIPADPPAPPPPPTSTSPSGLGSLENMLTEPITTFEDMLSLDASLDTSFESLSLPPLVLSPPSMMPQTPMPAGPSFISPTGTQAPTSSNSVDSDNTWNPDSWELPLSGLIANCGQQQQH